MQRLSLKLPLAALLSLTLLAGAATAGQLQRTDFAGVQPYTFDDDAAAVSPYDFGPFALENFFDMNSFWISNEAPVELPAPGGENIVLTLTAPAVAIGMDVSTNADVYFYGLNGVLLDTIAAADISVWPARNGFVGYSHDGGQLIYSVQIGTFDAFLDNVYIGAGAVATDEGSFGSVKSLYR